MLTVGYSLLLMTNAISGSPPLHTINLLLNLANLSRVNTTCCHLLLLVKGSFLLLLQLKIISVYWYTEEAISISDGELRLGSLERQG